MKPRLPLLYLALLALLLGASLFLLADWQRAQHCTCTLGGADYFDSNTDPREDCAAHGKEMP